MAEKLDGIGPCPSAFNWIYSQMSVNRRDGSLIGKSIPMKLPIYFYFSLKMKDGVAALPTPKWRRHMRGKVHLGKLLCPRCQISEYKITVYFFRISAPILNMNS